jgi:hypothetical protein
MNKYSFILLLLATSLALSCGSGSGRQLQSITISQTVSGQQIQFVATGTFSAAPITVTPLPVFWSLAPPPAQYTLTTQPFVLQCAVSGPYPSPIIAWAPANPTSPSSGSMSRTRMIVASTSAVCP